MEIAHGRIMGSGFVAVIDIGSNSVRLVVYEQLGRAPAPVFNEKVLCELGRGIAANGRMAEDSVEKALESLRRFRALMNHMGVVQCFAVATAASREAENGPAFLAEAESILGTQVTVLSGKEEAQTAAMGVMAGMIDPDGVIGDLGGGSLELVDLSAGKARSGITLPLGGIRLQEQSGEDLEKAKRICTRHLDGQPVLERMKGRPFYLVGGTWRSLAKLHMEQNDYPLRVTHHYRMDPKDALAFCKEIIQEELSRVDSIYAVSKPRRALLPYGAMALAELIRRGEPSELIVSIYGVREGHLYSMMDQREREKDPLLVACNDLAVLRSRAPQHAFELIDWTDQLLPELRLDETPEEQRLRRAACLVADIGWRAHQDYRGEQSLNIIANAAFAGIDHPGRAYLALANYFRHEGLVDAQLSPRIRELASERLETRARVLGAAFRVAYVMTASMPGILLSTRIVRDGETLCLVLPPELEELNGSVLQKRLRQMAKVRGLQSIVRVD
ncbi:Ppx/GppA phosphatase family protein [Coralliovum pocilloporae]|uniref:Ppx/GppA phosphatase family protein n=1 Tax=Coralliovum pocilloporae TaxID=3066369 RepID=UPI003307C265